MDAVMQRIVELIYAVPEMLVVLLIALGIAVWYFFTHFTLTSEPSVPAGGSSFSQSVAAGSGSLPASPATSGAAKATGASCAK